MKPIYFRLKPAVDKRILILLAGWLWITAGIVLLHDACHWLSSEHVSHRYLFGIIGFFCSLWIYQAGFLKIVDKNLRRILLRDNKQCLFSFMPLKSYVLVAIMMSMGILLRHSPVPKPWLAMLYVAIGLSLVFSSLRYLKVLIASLRKWGEELPSHRTPQE